MSHCQGWLHVRERGPGIWGGYRREARREISVTRPSGLLEPHAQKQRHSCEAVGNQSREKKQLQL